MKTPSRAFAVLSVVALLVSSSVTSCGVMFGAEEEDFCGESSCSLASQCPITSCLCDDGTSRSSGVCLTDKGCCAKTSFVCEQLCEPNGGWSGQSDAGTGGASGSAGRGGASGMSGSAGASGVGGASGFAGVGGSSGSSGSAGTGGSAGRAMVGGPCSGRSVSCGCTSASDTLCNQVFRCSSPTSAGRWEMGTQCDGQERCLMSSTRSTVGCGTTSFYVPYAVAGAPCLMGDTFACSLDLRSELFCSGTTWQVQENCSEMCGILRPGEPLCPSTTTTFCVGCL
jgi:hypothetical protein